MYLSPSDNSTVSAFLSTLSLEEHSHLTPDLGTVPIHNAFPIDSTHAALLQNYPLLSPCLDDLIWTTLDGTIPYLQHWYRINGISTADDTAISIPSICQSYVCFILQMNSISSCQVKQWHPQTTLWHQCWTPSTTLQSFHNPISIPLSTIQWRVGHEGNPTHAANSSEIRCGIHEEDGHYIVNCTKEQ